MTTQATDINTRMTKASGGIAALVDAVGLEQAFTAVRNAAPDQLDDTEKEGVIREIVGQQLARAQESVKTAGLSPEVISLLQQLVALMGPAQAAPPEAAPPPDAPGVPAPGEPPVEQAAAKGDAEAAAKALPSAQSDGLTLAEQKDSMSLGQAQKKGDEEAAAKALPAAQNDPGPGTIQVEQGITTPQQKADAWAWSRAADMGNTAPPKPKTYGHKTR